VRKVITDDATQKWVDPNKLKKTNTYNWRCTL